MTKLGRPKVPKKLAKAVLLGARFSLEEAAQVETAVKEAGADKSKWLRAAALEHAQKRPVWVNCNWSKNDLHGHKIEFHLTWPDCEVGGVGLLSVRESLIGKLSIDILGPVRRLGSASLFQNRYWVFQSEADKIEEHPNQEVARFRLLA